MRSQTGFVQLPRFAVWLFSLFVPAEEAESMVGDMLEEFSELVSKSGVAYARRWYRRQTLKSFVHLAAAGFRAAPWSMAAAVVAGYLLLNIGFWLYGWAFSAVLYRYRVYEHISELGSQQPSLNIAAEYVFWLNRGMVIGRVLVAATIGIIVAAAAKGRELTAVTAIGLFLAVLSVAGYVMMLARAGYHSFLFSGAIIYMFGSPIAIVAGGLLVRTLRLAAARRSSTG